MAIPLPELDNLEFNDLMEEAKSLIPVYAPDWTNYNLSDPGITLIELFAWLCEMAIYRVDQVPEKNYISFLKLLGFELSEGEDVSSGIKRAVEELNKKHRAITLSDFELQVKNALVKESEILKKYPDMKVRIICLPNKDMEHDSSGKSEKQGHVSLILVLKAQDYQGLVSERSQIKEYIKDYLRDRIPVSTRIHVVDPDYREVGINMIVAAQDKEVKSKIIETIEKFVDPIFGGDSESGWTPGRKLYTSDIYYLVERITGVDHVVRLDLECPLVEPHQLIKLKELTIEVES